MIVLRTKIYHQKIKIVLLKTRERYIYFIFYSNREEHVCMQNVVKGVIVLFLLQHFFYFASTFPFDFFLREYVFCIHCVNIEILHIQHKYVASINNSRENRWFYIKIKVRPRMCYLIYCVFFQLRLGW